MGFYEIFDIRDTGDTISATLQELTHQVPCKEDLTRVVYEAHRTLSEINPQNQQAFQSVLDSIKPKLGSS